MDATAAGSSHLCRQARIRGDGELRAYLPGVVCELALAITTYENLPPTLDPSLVNRVLDLYFTREDDRIGREPEKAIGPAALPYDFGALTTPGSTTAAVRTTWDQAAVGE